MRLQPAFDLLLSRYCTPITLEEAARAVYMSPSYLSAQFRKATGVSFSTYLTLLRLRRAEALRDGTDLTSEEIAARCGFRNMSNFYRLYRKRLGVPFRRRPPAPGDSGG